MLNIVSLIIGAIALLLVIPAFLPLLGIANWFIIPIALLGAGIGIASRKTSGRNLNLFVLVVAIVRLMLGGGLF